MDLEALNEEFSQYINLLIEASPPSGPAKRFAEKEEVKRQFKKRYGKRWERIFYSVAWKIFNMGDAPRKPSKKKKIFKEEDDQNFQGTDSLVRKYRNATPGQELVEAEDSGAEPDFDDKPYVVKYTNEKGTFYKSFKNESDAQKFQGNLKQKYGDKVKTIIRHKAKLRDVKKDREARKDTDSE